MNIYRRPENFEVGDGRFRTGKNFGWSLVWMALGGT